VLFGCTYVWCTSTPLSAWNISAPTGRIFVKFVIWVYLLGNLICAVAENSPQLAIRPLWLWSDLGVGTWNLYITVKLHWGRRHALMVLCKRILVQSKADIGQNFRAKCNRFRRDELWGIFCNFSKTGSCYDSYLSSSIPLYLLISSDLSPHKQHFNTEHSFIYFPIGFGSSI
jgi:hypothetical protein